MATLNIIVGSVYGNAENVAEEVQSYCEDQGIDAEVFKDPDVSDFTDPKALLVITSTTGAGDLPPNLEFPIDELRTQFPLLEQKPFAVAALGDSSYGESYCGGGRICQELLTELHRPPCRYSWSDLRKATCGHRYSWATHAAQEQVLLIHLLRGLCGVHRPECRGGRSRAERDN